MKTAPGWGSEPALEPSSWVCRSTSSAAVVATPDGEHGQGESVPVATDLGADPEAAPRVVDRSVGRMSGRENVAFVRSPTPLLPGIVFAPIPQRLVFWRRGFLRNVPGRWLLLGLTLVFSLPLLWQVFLGSESAVVETAPQVLTEPAVAVLVRDGEIHLDGVVSSDEMRNTIVGRVVDLMGDVIVVDDLRVDPDVVVDLSLPTPILLDETVRFDTGEARVVDRYEPLVATAAAMLLADDGVRLHLIGHTDSVGADAVNDALSLRRAEAVRSELIDRGVRGDYIEAEGRGETQPISENDSVEGRAVNRRVEFEVVGLLR